MPFYRTWGLPWQFEYEQQAHVHSPVLEGSLNVDLDGNGTKFV